MNRAGGSGQHRLDSVDGVQQYRGDGGDGVFLDVLPHPLEKRGDPGQDRAL